MSKTSKLISIIVGLALAAVVVFFGFRIFQERYGSASAPPQITTPATGITTSSFEVECVGSSSACEGQINYDTACNPELSLFATPISVETVDGGNTKVMYTVDLRQPCTDYYFRLIANNKTYDNAGTCYTVKTACGTESQPANLTPGPTGTAGGTLNFLAPVDQANCDVIKNNFYEADGYTAFNYTKKCLIKTTPTAAAN